MDKKRIKRILMREGLIIFVIITFSILLRVIPKQLEMPQDYRRIDDSSIFPQDKDKHDAVIKVLDFRTKYPQYDFLSNIGIAGMMAKRNPEWESVYKAMQRIKEESKGPYNLATSTAGLPEQASALSFWVLIFGYPVYLFIRFIFSFFPWVIRTLNKK